MRAGMQIFERLPAQPSGDRQPYEGQPVFISGNQRQKQARILDAEEFEVFSRGVREPPEGRRVAGGSEASCKSVEKGVAQGQSYARRIDELQYWRSPGEYGFKSGATDDECRQKAEQGGSFVGYFPA